MTGPQRLLDGADGAERKLLESAALDVPPPHAAKATLIALGLGAPALAAVSAASASAGAAGGAGKVAAGTGLAKLVLVTSAVAVVGGSAVVAPRLLAKPSPSQPAVAAPVTEAVPVVPLAPASRLNREAALLREALAALEQHDGAGALAALEGHAAEFPSGALREEAAALRVEALAAAGLMSEARRALASFRKGWPRSAFEARAAEAVINPAPAGDSPRDRRGIPPAPRGGRP